MPKLLESYSICTSGFQECKVDFVLKLAGHVSIFGMMDTLVNDGHMMQE